MSRSASDATRFTATGPHAYSKPSSSSSAIPKWSGLKTRSSQAARPSPGSPRQETPKEKVERLRAEARAARIRSSSSFFDRALERGRTWADRLHRVTVLSLIAASGIAGALTIYSMSSLIMHNRQQRALWIDREMQRLMDARKAYVAGTATPEQLELLEKEKAAEEEKRRKEELKKQGYIYKARQWLFGGLKQEDGTPTDAAVPEVVSVEKPGVLEAVSAKRAESSITPETLSKSPSDEPQDNGKQGDSGSKRSWTGWITGR
ncbi:hypothetical protein VTO42DRAFT_7286 [Malbranchea cinnamomea]